MNPPHETRVLPNPSDSVLMNLARAAFTNVLEGAEPSWPTLDLSDPRQRAFGDYELLQEIGRGGMGVVYRARQNSLEREVAIKFIAIDFADGSHVARFLSEARAAAKLNHPGIVPVHEVGSIDDVHYFSMPWIKGRTLADLIDSGSLSPDAIVSLILKLCEAIDYAHRLGLLHLDLKPANVLIDERGEPLIADFGLARHMDEQGGVDAQEVSGTPSFMAPEQILIKQYRMTPATDIYALGAILYRCLTGISPHGSGRSDEQVQRAIAGRVRPVRELVPKLSADLGAITMKCLELAQKERYPTVAALADDLRRVRDGLPVSVRRVGPVERLRLWVKREPRFAMAASVAAAALLIGTVATASQWNEATQQRDVAVSQRDSANAARKEAEAQRDLAQGMAELGAWLYEDSLSRDATGEQDDDEGAQEKKDVAVRMLEWLAARYPGDEHRQAAVLTAFAQAMRDDASDGNHNPFESLLLPVVKVMGSAYRKEMIEALVSGNEPNRYVLAARLAWNDEQNLIEDGEVPVASESRSFAELLEKAIATQPDNPDVWDVATTYCAGLDGDSKSSRSCRPNAVQQLVRLDPANAYHWLLRMMETEGAASRAALREAAQRAYFDDKYRAGIASYFEAVEKSRVPAPELLAGPARVLSPDTTPEFAIAAVETGAPLAVWQLFVKRCDPENGYFAGASAYEDCKAVGVVMSRSKASLLARMIGSVVVRNMEKDTPLAEEMIELRRRYLYVLETTGKLPTNRDMMYPILQLHRDNMELGELEAWESRLAYFGFPDRPPADWQPDDPRRLMTAKERATWDEMHPDSALEK